jgi:protein involved in polysaccharide export with SLBB domain
VNYPGIYTISSKNDRISDLVKRAGGLNPYAYPDGASLKRKVSFISATDQEAEARKLKKLGEQQRSKGDTSLPEELASGGAAVRNDFVGIDLARILDKPGRRYDLLLEDGDVLKIPKQLQTVRITGEVLSPSSVLYSSRSTLRSYIRQSGGFGSRALKRQVYVVYANGKIQSTKRFLFINAYPDLKPGAEIFVPRKDARRNGLSTSEVVAITTGLATIGALLITVFR